MTSADPASPASPAGPEAAGGPGGRAGVPLLRSLSSRLSEVPQWHAVGYAAALAGAAAAALAFGMWGNVRPRPQTGGFAGPGAFTEWGLPVSRLAVDMSMVGTIGMLVAAILLPRVDGALSDAARRCVRSGGLLALAWAVSTLAMLALLWSDASRLPVDHLTPFLLYSGPYAHPDAISHLSAAALAVMIALAASVTRTVRGVVVLVPLAVYNVLPAITLGREGESSLVGVAVTVHVVAISLWLGALAGLLAHARRSPELLAIAVPRFGRLALICLVAVGASGVTAAWLNLGSLSALHDSQYGMLVIYEVEALVGLGLLAWWHHRRTVPGMAGQRIDRTFTRFAAIEVVVMVSAVALGAALSHAPAPAVPPPPPPSSTDYTDSSAVP